MRNLKTQQLAAILYLHLSKTRTGKSHDYRKIMIFGVFKFLRFKDALKKLRFRDGLVWMVGLKFLQFGVLWTGRKTRLTFITSQERRTLFFPISYSARY